MSIYKRKTTSENLAIHNRILFPILRKMLHCAMFDSAREWTKMKYSTRYPSQFACQTGEVKKFNPMMDVIIA